ncbi:Formin FH2 domain [Trinorchestia longiramus]|nr:Formin FH2 domain [Trinorchestia longiramus]
MFAKVRTSHLQHKEDSMGPRGSAFGFRISSLNKLTDTKTSSDRSLTLLHYIISVCERQWTEVLSLDSDMTAVKEAAKISSSELEKDLQQLESGLTFIQKEVKWHEGGGGGGGGADRFSRAMKEFLSFAEGSLADLRAQFDDLTKLVMKLDLVFVVCVLL